MEVGDNPQSNSYYNDNSDYQQTNYDNQQWFYAKNKQKMGPYNPSQMIDLYHRNIIRPNTYVVCRGMKSWIQFSQSELSNALYNDIPDIPIEPMQVGLPVKDINTYNKSDNIFAWGLALILIISAILNIIIGNGIAFIITELLVIIFVVLDQREISKNNPNMKGIWPLTCLICIPLYLFVRAYKTDKKYGYAITSIITIIIALIAVIGGTSNISENTQLTRTNNITSSNNYDDALNELHKATSNMNIGADITIDNNEIFNTGTPEDITFVTDKNNLTNDLSNKLQSYKFIDSDYYSDSIGCTHVMIKVEAQENDRAIKITQLTTDSQDNIIDKTEDVVAISKGHMGVVELLQDKDKLNGHGNLTYEFTVEEYTPAFSIGSDNFNIEKYNVSDDTLYVTLQAYSDDVDTFSGIGILLYKNGKLIDADIAYPLDGFDSTGKAICSAWIYGSTDFDNIEFYYK